MILSPALNRNEMRDMSGNVTSRSYSASGSERFTNITIQPIADVSGIVNNSATGALTVSRPTNSAFNTSSSFASLSASQIQTAGTPVSASATTFTVAVAPERLTSIHQSLTLPSPSVAVFPNAGGTPYSDLSSYLASGYYSDTQAWRMPIITQSKSLFAVPTLLSAIAADVALAAKDSDSLSVAAPVLALNNDGSVRTLSASEIEQNRLAAEAASRPALAVAKAHPLHPPAPVEEERPYEPDSAFWQELLGSQSGGAFVDEETEQIAQTTGIGYVQAQARIDEQTSLAARQASTIALVKSAFTQYQVGFEKTYADYAENKAQEAGRKAKEKARFAAAVAAVAGMAVSAYLGGGPAGGAAGGVVEYVTYETLMGRPPTYLIGGIAGASVACAFGKADACEQAQGASSAAGLGAAAGTIEPSKGSSNYYRAGYYGAGGAFKSWSLDNKSENDPAIKKAEDNARASAERQRDQAMQAIIKQLQSGSALMDSLAFVLNEAQKAKAMKTRTD